MLVLVCLKTVVVCDSNCQWLVIYITTPVSTAKIQGMKNSVPKNDKKRRKQLLEDVAKLEAQLEQKHTEELKKIKDALPEQNQVCVR